MNTEGDAIPGRLAYKDARRCLHDLGGEDVGRGATDEEITEAERQLGVGLPESYKLFLAEFGWGGVGHWELYGLGEDVPPYLHLVALADSEHEGMPSLPRPLVPIMNDGGGNLYCLDVSRLVDEECPVVFWDHESGESADVAESFGSWLASRVKD